ncbi:MAG: TonB-dependent receptor [Rhodospirillaceae bacterium]|nr:TonB-dependent receptor [Rhodospirillaceae bacterium]
MRHQQFGRTFIAALSLTSALVGFAPLASAQIEEIVVTARKREESLQEVPIVIQAFTSESIERKGIATLDDVAKLTSGLMLDEGANKQDTRIVIRGLSPTRGRQNVAILQDDVDISSLAQGTAGGSFVINPRLLDMERIEVIKGPHSALFGRSAFNGAINYITKKPGDEVYRNVQVDVADHNKYEGRFSVSGPVVPGKLSLGVNGAAWTFDGFYDSAVNGDDLGTNEGYGIAGSFTATPSETLKLTGRIEYADEDFGPEARGMKGPVEFPLPASAFTTNGGPINPATVTNRTFPQVIGSLGKAKNFPAPAPSLNPRTGEQYPGSNREIFRSIVRLEADFDAVQFTSITHYGDNKSFLFNDFLSVGDVANPLVNGAQETYFDTNIKLFTEEVRLQSKTDGPLSWTLGGLFWKEKLEQSGRSLVCAAPGGGCAAVLRAVGNNSFVFSGPAPTITDLAPDATKRVTEHISGYGLLEYAVTDKLKASVELRYTVEEEDTSAFAVSTAGNGGLLGCPGLQRSFNAQGIAICNPIFGATTPLSSGPLTTDPNSFTNVNVGSVFWVPRFTVDYKATDDALIYASAAMGKKPGGLSPLGGVGSSASNANNTYEPEVMWVYELGAKTTWLDGRLMVNGAVYYQDYSKKQVSISFINPNSTPPGLLATRVVNAGAASVKGFELDVSAAPVDNVTLTASYTYNDGKYDTFTDITSTGSTIARAAVNNPAQACTPVQVTVAPTTPGGQPTTAVRCQIDYSGNRLEGAPKHSLVMGGEVRGDLSAEHSWFLGTDIRYQTERFTSFENSLKMNLYWLVDLRAGVRTDSWSITAYANNLFNDDTLKASAVYIPDWNLSFISPRTFGVVSGASALLPDKRLIGVRASMNF